MTFGQSLGACMRQYATFSGRARRSEFWWFMLVIAILGTVISLVFFIFLVAAIGPAIDSWQGLVDDLRELDSRGTPSDGEEAWLVLKEHVNLDEVDWSLLLMSVFGFVVLCITFAIPYFSVMTRRLHDMGQPGGWVFLSLIGLGIVPIVMCFFDSEARDNRWGPDPKVDERIGWGHSAPVPPPSPAEPLS